MAVVDMNGDGRDDLVRLHETDRLMIDYQNEPGQVFSAYDYGEVPRGSIWAVCAADVDRNGFNDLFVLHLFQDKLLLCQQTLRQELKSH